MGANAVVEEGFNEKKHPSSGKETATGLPGLLKEPIYTAEIAVFLFLREI